MFKKLFLLIALPLIVPISAVGLSQEQEYQKEYQAGYQLGYVAGQKETPFWNICFWSLLFPLPSMLLIGIMAPEDFTPSMEMLIFISDKSEAYRAGFMDGYKKGKRIKRRDIAASCGGVGMLIGLILLLPTIGRS